jgi:GTPase SAR1 family protein
MENLLEAAVQFINTTAGHIFLTGKAGTGKTTFLKELKNVTHKSLIVVAPTGIAALNAGGVTIHSQFLLPPVTFLPDRFLPEGFTEGGKFLNQNVLARKHPLNSARKQVLRSIDLLVIDEVSMLRADLLDAIDYRMKAARGNFKQSFGGVQVLFIGDLYQLPPVVRNEEQSVLSNYYKSPWFYEAKALQEDRLVYIELDKIFRQHDQEFIDVLNNLRNNIATIDDIALLNQHYKEPAEIKELKEVITLTTHNYKADEINKRELQSLPSESHFFEANVEGDFLESMNPVPQRIELKENAQVMFVRNDTSEEKKYFNGKLATVKRISQGNIFVELADTHELYMLRKERWENKKYTVNTATNDLDEDVIGSFEQYPIKLAWAITVHKSQGLTFDKAIIDVDQAFTGGQVYVALSRLRSLQGLILRSKINSSVISTDKDVVAFAKANHKPEGLGEVMKSKQREFLHQFLNSTFDFSLLVKDINYVQKDQTEEGFAEESMKPVLVQLVTALEAEQSNTENFRRQLSGLLATADHTKLLERLEKGSSYYRTLLNKWIHQLLEHLESTKFQKRVKVYLNHLNELDIAFNKKLVEIDKALLLTAGILQGNLKFDFLPLSEQRAAERVNMLSEINKELDSNPPAGAKRKGSKSKKKRKDEPSTYEVTLGMVNKGMTVEQISEERGLAVGTIESHFAKLVQEGLLDVYRFMTEPEVVEIKAAIKQLPAEFTSKDLYDHFRGKFGYGKLRAVMADKKKDSQQEQI